MKHLILISVPLEGEISNFKRKEIGRALNEFRGKNVTLTVERKYNKRSNQQNKFYFGCIIEEEIQCFKEFWGEIYTKDQIHEWNKTMFWAEEKIVNDEVVKKPCSSTPFTTVQWEEKIELIRQWFYLKFEWVMPLPNQQTEIFN